MVWRKKRYRDGSFVLKEGRKWIHVHKSMDTYWIDYGVGDRGRVDTDSVRNRRDLKPAVKRIMRQDFGGRIE